MTPDDAPAKDDGGALDRVVADQLAPFVAWLATRSLDETARRRIRIVVEGFLLWSRTDPGPVGGRRRRYEEHLRGRRPADLPTVREGLDRWAEHRVLVARTLPIDGR